MINNHSEHTSDSIKKWKRLNSTIVFEYPRITLAEDEVELPTGKAIKYIRQIYNGNGGVIIVCVQNGKLLVQQEYSYPVDEVLYQFPGGRIEDSETHQEAAKRELAEESGLQISNPTYLGWFYPDNRRTNAKLHVVFSDTVADEVVATPDETEFITTMWLPVAEFKELLQTGKITNYAMLAAWALSTARYPELLSE